MSGSGIGTITTSSSTWYSTLAEIKAHLNIPTATTTYDTELEQGIEAASRFIDSYCNRRFYKSPADETFYYTPRSGRLCFIDELIDITSIKTDDDFDGIYETTWTSSDYYLMPYNMTPKTSIELTLRGGYFFYPHLPKSVQVVGKFGYSATAPLDVKMACIIEASRLFKRRDAILGIAGTSQFGQVKLMDEMDPDVRKLLRSYARVT
jgi:hypothetical protein